MKCVKIEGNIDRVETNYFPHLAKVEVTWSSRLRATTRCEQDLGGGASRIREPEASHLLIGHGG